MTIGEVSEINFANFTAKSLAKYAQLFSKTLKSRGILTWDDLIKIKSPRMQVAGQNNHYVEHSPDESGLTLKLAYVIIGESEPIRLVPLQIDIDTKNRGMALSIRSDEKIPNYGPFVSSGYRDTLQAFKGIITEPAQMFSELENLSGL